MHTTYDSDKRKLLSAICHGCGFFGLSFISIGIPIAIMLVSDDPVVKDSAKESISFHINLWVLGGVLGFLYFILIGWLLSPILIPVGLFYNFALPAFAVYRSLTAPDEVFKYPFIFRLPL